MNEKMENVEGSGNVFRDLGFDNPEEELRKAELASTIYDIIEGRELSRKDAGEALGLNQEKLSALRNGNLADFSTATLQSYIKILEHNFVVSPLPEPKERSGGVNAAVVHA